MTKVVSRSGAIGCLLAVAACGGDVRVTDDGASDGGATASDGGATASDGGAGGSAAGVSVWPGQTYSTVYCYDDGPQLFVEIWPDAEYGQACVANAGIDLSQVLVIGISGWDYTPGVFALEQTTLHGTAHASLSGGIENASGSLTVEPFDEVPGIISWDLDFAQGSTDLSVCFYPQEEPCAVPD